MKMFKKLMAVALAGVMALTVLTGCAGTINKKEYVNVMNDMVKAAGKDLTVEQGSDKLNVMKMAIENRCKLNEVDEEKLGNTATASIATQKIGDTTFLVIVLVRAAK